MYALWPSSRGTCVPLQSWEAWRRPITAYTEQTGTHTVDDGFHCNYNISLVFFCRPTCLWSLFSTWIFFVSNHSSGYMYPGIWISLSCDSRPPDLLLRFYMCMRRQRQSNSERKKCLCVLIYDAVLVINMALLSHLDTVIDTRSGRHMGRELELQVRPVPHG